MKKTTDAVIILKKELGITGNPDKERAIKKEKEELLKQMKKNKINIKERNKK